MMNNHRALKMPSSLIAAHAAVVEACCEAFDVSPEELLSAERTARIVLARHAAMWLMRQTTSLSLMDIGALFEMDHGTVLYACRRSSKILAESSHAGEKLRAIHSKFTTQSNA